MQGIPTRYNSRLYRSRLEARWAAFFDLVDWHYEYEPFDLNGWIPDFLIVSARGPILVEVKPTGELSGFPLDKIRKAIEAADEKYAYLLLGPSIEKGWTAQLPIIGFICLGGILGEATLERLAATGYGCGEPSSDGIIGLHNCGASDFSRDPITGLSPNWLGGISFHEAQAMWNEAGNRVQWKAPQLSPVSNIPDRQSSTLQEAKAFLLTLLQSGGARTGHIKKEAKKAGVGLTSIMIAKDELKIEIHADEAGWSWFLPGKYQAH